jgi:hypothetical protein
MDKAHLTQGSIEKISQWSGKLDLLLGLAWQANWAVSTYDHKTSTEAQDGAFDDKLAQIGLDIAELVTVEMLNDLGQIFKELYNRRLDSNLLED